MKQVQGMVRDGKNQYQTHVVMLNLGLMEIRLASASRCPQIGNGNDKKSYTRRH
jgi:hypothetical protein